MNQTKFISALLIFTCTSYLLYGQTLIGVKGGLNYSTIFNEIIPTYNAQKGYKSYPSYCVEFNLKGRKPTPIHAGLAISYSLNSFNYHSEGTGHFPNGENINYNVECVRLTIFPEFTVGKRFQFFCNLSPYINVIISSSKNGTTWDYVKWSLSAGQY